METKDLMIGDWVMHENEPIMVWEIDDYYYRINTEPDGYNAITCIEISEVTPIHLTPEILEKNFLVQRGEWTEPILYFFSNDYIEISIKEYTDGIWEVVVDEVENGVLPTWKMYVSNVHELQHAMRLSGIDKTIEL